MNPFGDDYDDKINIRFEIQGHGKKTILINEYKDDVHWSEIVDDVVRTMESTWSYAFDITEEDGLGIYYPGKRNGSS